MNKKLVIVALFALVLLTLNFSVAQDVTDVELQINENSDVIAQINDTNVTAASDKMATHIDVAGNTTFDVVGEYFKINLSYDNNKAISNVKVTFKVNGVTYTKTTDSKGIASLQIRLYDGSYAVVTKFAGNSKYQSSSLTTKITMNNTRVVDSGLSSSQIQQIIDNAKENNVILFKGSSYSDINLVITKSLTLMSNVDTALKSSSASPVITIKGKTASLTTVKGFDIQGNGNGIEVNGADYVTIYKNKITTKQNGIVAVSAKYLNITKNNIVKNSKNGITIADSSYIYVFNNKISNNGVDGIDLAKSSNIYIHGNTISNNDKKGIYFTNKVNGVTYKEDSKNIHINQNTISKNGQDGINIESAGDDIYIKSNTVDSNKGNGIALGTIGSNTIQSNIITNNWENGIKFYNYYVKPSKQEISYNAIFSNLHMDVEAKETYYQENGERLQIGDNWYTDFKGVCPKIKTNSLKFVVTQIGANTFQATFYDSNGNIASLLPDRTLTYKTANGQTLTTTISGGAGTFTVDANDGDIVSATVDNSKRDNTYNSNSKSSSPINGVSPSYTYPPIPQYQLYGDIGNGTGQGGSGNGHGDGSNGENIKGNSQNRKQNSKSDGNSTGTQNQEPSANQANPINDISQSSDVSSSPESASSSGSASGQSVVKQILIDDDEFFKVTGISFIILLIILTICFYYREDIREMKSKM